MGIFPSKNDKLTIMKNEITPTAVSIPNSLMIAVRKVLYPLVRLLLSFRIAFPQLAEILKSVYVEVANDEFKLPKKKQTDTRLSLLTGIHRKDIKRLNNQVVTDQKTPDSVDISTRIIARWLVEKQYLDDNKKPLKLPLQADKKTKFSITSTGCVQAGYSSTGRIR